MDFFPETANFFISFYMESPCLYLTLFILKITIAIKHFFQIISYTLKLYLHTIYALDIYKGMSTKLLLSLRCAKLSSKKEIYQQSVKHSLNLNQ